jgi:hypothetical protein
MLTASVSSGFGDGELPELPPLTVPEVEAPVATPADEPAPRVSVLGERFTNVPVGADGPGTVDLPGNSEVSRTTGTGEEIPATTLPPTASEKAAPKPASEPTSGTGETTVTARGPVDIDPLTPGAQPLLDRGGRR